MKMNEELLIFLGILLFWASLYVIHRAIGDKFKKEISIGPFYLYVKTSKLNRLFEDFSKRNSQKISKILSIGVGTCVIAMVYAIYILSAGVYNLITLRGAPAVMPILPGITVSIETFMKMIPAITIVVLLHELFHKIAFHIGKLRIKSIGFGIFLMFPFAFVEPDEEKFKKSGHFFKMKALAAGSFINLITAAILAPPVVYPPIYDGCIQLLYGPPAGLIVVGIEKNSPIDNFTHIKVGDIIVKIDSSRIRTIRDLDELDLPPKKNITISYYRAEDLAKGELIERSEWLITESDPLNKSRGVIGILSYSHRLYPLMTYYPPRISGLSFYLPKILFEVLFWAFMLSFSVGIFNMLPIYPLDGYEFLKSLLEALKLDEELRRTALYGISGVSLFLLMMNLLAALW